MLSGLRNRSVWKNYKEVVFQASVNDCSIPRLSIYMINNFILSPQPTCHSRFLDSFVSPLLPPSISIGRCCCTFNLQPLPTSFPVTERCPPGSRQPPPLPDSAAWSTTPDACLRLPLCPASFAPSFLPSACTQVPAALTMKGWMIFLCICVRAQ